MHRILLAFLALLLPLAAQAQPVPAKPTYSWVTFQPQSGTPGTATEGTCWQQGTSGFYCYYNGAPHGPFISAGDVSLTVGTTPIASGTTGRALFQNGSVLGEWTQAQLTSQISSFSSSLSGAAPASGGGTTNFLRADGSWATPPGTGAPGGSSGNVQYNNSGSFGGYTDTQLTTHINAFTSSLSGAAPSSGGGTTNFLRADGTWAVPPGTGTGTVTTTGSPASGNLTKFTGAASISNGDLSGDATTTGTLVVTVARINGATLGTTTATGGNLLIGSGTQWVSTAMSGDATITSGGAIALATVNTNTGTWGDGTHVGQFTVNGKGLITGASSVAITGAAPTGSAGGDLSGTYPNPTVAKVNGVTHPSSPSVNTVPVVTNASGGGTVTYEAVPNSALQNASTTVNGTTCTLGASCSVSAASSFTTATGVAEVANSFGGL